MIELDFFRTVTLPALRARFTSDERGASMVEYALVLALIAVVGVVGLTFLGNTTKDKLCSTGEGIAGGTWLTHTDGTRYIDDDGTAGFSAGDTKGC